MLTDGLCNNNECYQLLFLFLSTIWTINFSPFFCPLVAFFLDFIAVRSVPTFPGGGGKWRCMFGWSEDFLGVWKVWRAQGKWRACPEYNKILTNSCWCPFGVRGRPHVVCPLLPELSIMTHYWFLDNKHTCGARNDTSWVAFSIKYRIQTYILYVPGSNLELVILCLASGCKLSRPKVCTLLRAKGKFCCCGRVGGTFL